MKALADSLLSGRTRNVVALCGAGMSVSAGIPDFRSPGTGLYDTLQHLQLPRPELVFDLAYFRTNPAPFWTVANAICPQRSVPFMPTRAHNALKQLADLGVLRRVYTQNIDGLERSVGLDASLVVQAHGTFDTSSCIECGVRADLRLPCAVGVIPRCDICQGLVKPDIVFFGEALPDAFGATIDEDLAVCDLLVVVGTSLSVEPFASLIGRVGSTCARLLINNDLVGWRGGLDDDDEEDEACAGRFRFADRAGRDVFCQGPCDDGMAEPVGCQQVSELLETFAGPIHPV